MLKFIKKLFEKDPLLDKAIIEGLKEENKLLERLWKEEKRKNKRLTNQLNKRRK